MVPPKINVSKEDLEQLKSDVEQMKAKYLDEELRDEQVSSYTKWLSDLLRKVAPGFDFDIMKPTKKQ